MSNIHDNRLVGYSVDCELRRIELRTEFREPGRPLEKTDVIFDGVEAYSFRDDCMGNIIFDISEQPLEPALSEHWAEFEAGHKRSGWPRFWMGSESKTRERIARLVEDGAKWFELSSSYGMQGWVLCRTLEYCAPRT